MIQIKTTNRTAFLDLAIAQGRMRDDIRASVRLLAREYRARVVAAIRSAKRGERYARRAARSTYRRQRQMVQLFGGRTATARVVRGIQVRTGTYTASAPGEAPANFTGTLLRSLKTRFGVRDGAMFARVYADRRTAFYRHMLEFGTGPRTIRRATLRAGRGVRQAQRVGSGSIEPRPLFSPLQAQLERDLMARVQRAANAFAAGR